MDPGTKYPTRIFGFFHYPSPTRARLLIPGRYPKPEMLPAGTRRYPTRENLLNFQHFSPIFRNFWVFSAKFSNFFGYIFGHQIFEYFFGIFLPNFEIYGYFLPKFQNFWLFSAKTLKFSSKFTQPTTRRVPGIPEVMYPTGTSTTRARPEPDYPLPEPARNPTFCYPTHLQSESHFERWQKNFNIPERDPWGGLRSQAKNLSLIQ